MFKSNFTFAQNKDIRVAPFPIFAQVIPTPRFESSPPYSIPKPIKHNGKLLIQTPYVLQVKSRAPVGCFFALVFFELVNPPTRTTGNIYNSQYVVSLGGLPKNVGSGLKGEWSLLPRSPPPTLQDTSGKGTRREEKALTQHPKRLFFLLSPSAPVKTA